MSAFTTDTLHSLTKAGWYPGRKIPTFQYRARLTGAGYAWFPQVEDFLTEFEGLTIRFIRNGHPEVLSIDAYDASDVFDRAWMTDDYSQRIGRQQFCVIGTAYTSHLLLFMDDVGQVYGCFDDFLCLIGSSGLEAIAAICTNQPSREIA